MAAATFKIENGGFGLSLTDPGKAVDLATLTDYTDFSCQVTSGAIVPTPNTETEEVPATWCDPASEVNIPTATSFALAISVLQDPHVAAGLAQFMYANDTATVYWYLGFDETDGAPKAIGSAICVPATTGGDARTTLTADVSMACNGKPQVGFGTTATLVPTPA